MTSDITGGLFDRPNHRLEANRGTERVVLAVLRAQHGDDAVAQRPMHPGTDILSPAPTDWAQGMEAARLVEENAHQLWIRYALRERSEGTPWAALADALGVPKGSSDRGVDAFRLVAPEPSMQFDPRYVRWKCGSCGQLIRDSGPYDADPRECEHGHATGCAQHAREIAAYRRGMNDGQ